MADIAVHELNKYYGSNHVIKGISFEIYSGEKVGLLGRNGSGKTTVFKILAGIEPYESGNVSKTGGKKIEMLAQIPVFGEDDTVDDILYSSFKEVSDIYNEMKKVEGDDNPAALSKYGRLMEEYELMGGYDIEVKTEKVCNGMNIDETMRKSLFSSLSGGEKTRVNLARILLRDCDILLLDEPTNHLDLPSLAWVEKFLREFAGTVVVISHDRAFLDNVIDRIIEIENGTVNFFSGNYSWYAEEKERRITSQAEQYERQQKEIKRIEERAKWFVEQNRFTTKHHAILSRIDHMDKIERPTKSKKLTESFGNSGFAGKELVSFDSVCKSYGEKKIFENINLTVYRNNRIALIGENGCGKTTLVKMITGEQSHDSGEVKTGNSTKIAYMPQIIDFENKEATVLETFCYETASGEDKARNVLAGFHFRAKDVMKKTGSLSGGEKSRLKLCLLMQGSVNFLILDEPTNHLDIESREWIEDAIYDFNGTILFISHDRYFLEKFAERVWSIEDGEIIEYNNGLDEYLEKLTKPKSRMKADPTASKQKSNSKANKQSKDSKNFKEDKNPEKPKAEEIENRIAETEAKINATQNEIDAESDSVKIDYKKIDELYKEKLRLEDILDSLYAEWISFSHGE